NVCEGAGKRTLADKARVFAIARGEAVEAAGVIEVALLMGVVDTEPASRCLHIAGRLVALLSGLIRRRYGANAGAGLGRLSTSTSRCRGMPATIRSTSTRAGFGRPAA